MPNAPTGDRNREHHPDTRKHAEAVRALAQDVETAAKRRLSVIRAREQLDARNRQPTPSREFPAEAEDVPSVVVYDPTFGGGNRAPVSSSGSAA